ncbi:MULTISPECIES: AAA family ATPase [unclassified Paenibacillus]|uniref:AAA family ATPase n=1 Tax=unclassified Paenibacillus TaxID=185978 RepID=UPI00034E9917|nr:MULTISPECIES: AAA family ATPase [unclassified Paenibacillus]EPD81794.1 hypothetical protein HMPREF1207_05552 [Paenibacillus sp. HGH0039]
MFYIFCGLPGTGKSTLSSALARELQTTYLRVDVVEQAMRVAGTWDDGPAGYIVCYAIASQNLRLGLDVIADTVNPIHETRAADIPGFVPSTGEKVRNRHYDVWDREHIVIDTAHQTAAESLMTLRELLDRERSKMELIERTDVS